MRLGFTPREIEVLFYSMANDSVILRFSGVNFEYDNHKLILDDASFSVRTGSRVTLMGQNGAGKSSLFKLITGETKPTEGALYRTPTDATIAIARQVMPMNLAALSVRDYFASAFDPAIGETQNESEGESSDLNPGSQMHSAEMAPRVPYNLDK